MKLRRYTDFIFPINESELVFSDKFRNILKKVDSPVSQGLLDLEKKDYEFPNNYIDIGDNKNQITFITDRKAKEILSGPEVRQITLSGGGYLKHTEANAEIFSTLGYTPEGPETYKPQSDEKGELVSETEAPSGNTYVMVKFPNGTTVVNKNRVIVSDSSKLPFTKNRQPGRVGASIQTLLRAANVSFSNAEIEQFVNKYKSEFDKLNNAFRKKAGLVSLKNISKSNSKSIKNSIQTPKSKVNPVSLKSISKSKSITQSKKNKLVRLKNIFRKNKTNKDQLKNRFRAYFLKTICSDASVCIAFGREENKIDSFLCI
jgi:hypothetical protein